MNIIQTLEAEQMKTDLPKFGPGDTVRAWLKVVEGGKERLQAFEGICITRNRRGGDDDHANGPASPRHCAISSLRHFATSPLRHYCEAPLAPS